MKNFSTISLLSFVLPVFMLACSSTPKGPPPEPPEEIDIGLAPIDEYEAPPPTLHIADDEQVPEKFRKTFAEWLDEDIGGIYERVVHVDEVSNAAQIVLERKLTMGETCRLGVSTLELVEAEGGEVTVGIEHFGDDCCPGTTCEMVIPLNWNMRYLNAVEKKDHAMLATLVSAKTRLVYKLVTPDGSSTKKLSKTDVAAGKLEAPGCGFTQTRPRCDQGDDKGFMCFCDGGGYHVSYEWKKEGDVFVLVKIDEQSS